MIRNLIRTEDLKLIFFKKLFIFKKVPRIIYFIKDKNGTVAFVVLNKEICTENIKLWSTSFIIQFDFCIALALCIIHGITSISIVDGGHSTPRASFLIYVKFVYMVIIARYDNRKYKNVVVLCVCVVTRFLFEKMIYRILKFK